MPLLTPTVNGQYAGTPPPEPVPPRMPTPVSRVRRVRGRHASWLVLGWVLALVLYAGLLVAQPIPVAPIAPPVVVWGNLKSGIYHLPHCSNYPRTTQPGRHWRVYASREAAEAAGLRMARNCRRVLGGGHAQ